MDDFKEKLLRPVWVEIDLDALRHNFQETRRLVGDDVSIICCLKANAYGIGSLEVAEEVISMGAYGLVLAPVTSSPFTWEKKSTLEMSQCERR